MPVLMFKPQFAELVREGTKLQTVRPRRKRPIKVGNALSLRAWLGLPYRSKQRLLRADTCRKTYDIDIDAYGLIWTEGGTVLMPVEDMQKFARADGFADHAAMIEWFRATHSLPFAGTVISWAP